MGTVFANDCSQSQATTPPPSYTPEYQACIRWQLRKIINSRGFANSHRLKTLLTHVVEATLNESVEHLKETVIAEELFRGTTEGFVRSLASRLRTKLDAYYGTTGRTDQMIITMPAGGYRAVFVDGNEVHGLGN